MDTSAQVRKARAGDPAAREALARAWLGRAFGTALAVLGRPEDAEDAVQDAFARAFARLGELRDPERFGAWLSRIVRHAALDLLRRRRRREGPRPDAGLAAAGPAPDAAAQAAEAWAALTPGERLIAWLVLVEGLSFAAVAEWTGISRSAVHRRWQGALARLRKEHCHVDL